MSLTFAGASSLGTVGPWPFELLLAGAGVGICGALAGSGVAAAGTLGISEASGVRRVGAAGALFKASSSRLSLSIACKWTESSEYVDCCAGAIG